MKKLPAALIALGLTAAGALAAAPAASATAAPTAQTPQSYRPSGLQSADLHVLESDGTLSTRSSRLPLLPFNRVRVNGLTAGDRLVGLDTRPANGALYALGQGGQLYRLNATTGAATAVGLPAAGPVGAAVGFDFNPTVDRIRVVTSAGRNLRLNPDTGAVAGEDLPLAYSTGGSVPRVAAVAYTNSVAGATSTGLYALDAATDKLFTQGTLPGSDPVVSPNTGRLFGVGRLGVDITAVNGFDIRGTAGSAGVAGKDGTAIAAIRTDGFFPGRSKLVRIDLRTGRATPLLALGLGRVVGLTYATR